MDPVVSITEHAEFLHRLGSSLPAGFDRYGVVNEERDATAAQEIALRFAYRDVPFFGRVERRGAVPVLRLTGAVGPLPFSAQAARRRRRALSTLVAAGRVPLNWRVSTRQEISVEGTIELARPLSPATIVTGAVQLLLQGERYLSLLLDVLGDAGDLNSSRAA